MNAFLITIYAVCGIYMLLNFKHDIQMLQQNSYRPERYWRWLRGNMGTAWRLTDVALLFLLFSTLLDIRLSALIIGLTCLTKSWLILTKKYKKPLVFTKRVWRIYSITALLALSAYLATIFCTCGDSSLFGFYSVPSIVIGELLLSTVFSWVFVMTALLLLMPVEKNINNRYRNDAMRILRSMPDLTVVGITGSYGKTSTKHYLNRILSESYDVLMTPGSYNTPMGVIRTIREMMKPYNQVFICEMGAKQKGDVKEICDMVDPQIGIVTAVGPMHLETFKSIENVQSTKFELIDALPDNGLGVVNNDFEYCANRPVDNVKVARYGVANHKGCDFTARDISYSPDGTSFTVEGADGFRETFETRLVGECNISNLLAAIIVALRMKVPAEKIRHAVRDIEQVEHRLSIARTPGGVTIIDDAFNSNPSGSKMAIDVLSQFTSGKRIVITPGMIELGEKQFELNEALGYHIGGNVDVAIVVGEYNREAIVKGITEAGFDTKHLHETASFNEAQKLLATILAPGDTVLYENDLPDTFK